MTESILNYDEKPIVDTNIVADDPATLAKLQNEKRANIVTIPKDGLAGPGRILIQAWIEVPSIMSDGDVDGIRRLLQSAGIVDLQTTGTLVTKNIPGYGSKIHSSFHEEMMPIPPEPADLDVE